MTDDMYLVSSEEQPFARGPVHTLFADSPADASRLSLLELIQAQVATRPDALAVMSEDGQLTYAMFDRCANNLAHHLLQQGAGPEVCVGICLERSCEMLVGLYAVLKTGAAYVPLDPAYPGERLLFMLEDAKIRTLITTSHLQSRFAGCEASQVCLEKRWWITQEPEAEVAHLPWADALAYVIYTSGSTGEPKGVQVTRRGLHNLVSWHLRTFGLTPQDRTSQVASWSFDAAGWELWPALAGGATVCMASEEVRAQPRVLFDWLLAEQITVSFVPTPLAQELLAAQWPDRAALRLLLTGGDRLRHRPAHTLPFAVINNYGPTEYSVVATSGRVDALREPDLLPSIGRPIAETQVYILDRQLRPVPAGTEGELYLGGTGLARSYLHRPALTAERFVPDPFSQKPGARLYRTGDLVRADSEGNLHFLGRIDQQVKIRGIRVELGEIEAALSQLPAVREALVLLRKGADGEPRLVAYLVACETQALSLHEVRQHLQMRLPTYMLPSAMVPLEHFPLTPNGKIDREALPDPGNGQADPHEPFLPPRNFIEAQLAEIWANLLGLPRIDRRNNFFALGGHSLLATRAIARTRERLHVELTLRTLFDFPTIEQLALQIERLTSRNTPRSLASIGTTNQQQGLPLSFAQQRLWFLDQLEPGNPFYNVAIAIQLEGNVQVSLLNRCFDAIIQRHVVLRTAFTSAEGKPLQVVSPSASLFLPLIDLQGLCAQERQLAFERLAVEEGRRPFDLSKSPLLRVNLLRLSDRQHVLLLCMHHIVSDDWSMEIFLRELSAHYEAFALGTSPILPALPIQYADFALWQREWLRGERLEQQLAYWQRQLADLPLLQLPTDRPHPLVQSYRGARLSFAVPPDVTEKIRGISRRPDTTLFMTLLAAFNVLLYRYSGQTDLVVGSPIANRMRSETRDLVGFFVNTLVLRTRLTGAMTFGELLEQVHETALEAYAHQDIPFEKLVEELQPERNLMRQPLFQAAFALLNDPLLTLCVADVTLRLQDIDNGTAKFDLTLFMNDEREQLTGILEYNTDIFDAATVASMAEHFCTLLQGIASYPEQPIATLPLLPAAERARIVQAWNATEAAYPARRCVHELFEDQARRCPDAVAVSYDECQLTYAALNEYANQLAHLLRRSGVEPEVPVGVYLERSPELIIGLLGILKAGGAYVPVDQAYPKERLAFLLQDAHISLVLTQQKLRAALPDQRVQVVCLDSDRERIARASRENPRSGAQAENLAYIIYTSGSTGQPKGVSIPHKAINRLVCNTDYAQLGSADRVAQASNASFDAATFEIWGALLNGGRLVGIAKETMLDPLACAETLRQQQITTLFVTTALFNQSVKERPDIFQPLRHLLFGGEAVDPRWVREALTHGSPERLLHVYGPTENTTFSSWYQVCHIAEDAGTVPIGRPIANTQLYVLDRYLQPVPLGVRGELYVGGEGLARDYRGYPALTAASYIPHPFATRPGARLYRTGDLVRQLADGCIEFLGRVDHQVKVRGFRVELGEIEANLNQHPAVEEAVVSVREDIPGDKRLVAYIVPAHAGASEDLPGEHLATWQELFDETYRSSAQEGSEDFNIVGWNSSYTDQPLPYEHMREWREHTIEGIQAAQPRRVLEIGCGTGLLLLRLAPDSSKYWGTDFSAEVLHQLQRQVEERHLAHVQLLQRMADDFSGLEEQTFDTIILNSIVQYFPGVEYLLQVLDGSLQKVVPGGTIFLGDIRNQQLLELFHTSLALYKSDDAAPLDQFQQRIQANIAQESELLLDPAFFYALQQRYPQISQVCIRPKRGRYDNELTTFRYDVQLRIGSSGSSEPLCTQWRDWEEQGLSLSELRELLTQQRPTLFALTRIPNARLVRERAARRLLSTPGTELATVGDLRRALSSCSPPAACTPEDLYVLGQQLGYGVDVRWSGNEEDGSFDAVFSQPSNAPQFQSLNWPRPSRIKSWSEYANQPLREDLRSHSRLVPELRAYLQTRLSEYMLPSTFVFLDTLPLNANGKVDRRALPAPAQSRPLQNVAYLGPRDPIEELLVNIWVEVLGIEQIGVHDNFFEIGGHSLLATQVTSRMSDAFQMAVPLRTIFEFPTIEELARALCRAEKQPGQIMAIARLQKKLASMPIEKIREALQSKKQMRGA